VAVRAPRDRLRSSAAESSDDAVVSDAIGRGPGHVGFIVCAPDPCGAPEGGRKPIGREELGAGPSASRTLRISLRSSSWPRNFSASSSTRWRSSTQIVRTIRAWAVIGKLCEADELVRTIRILAASGSPSQGAAG